MALPLGILLLLSGVGALGLYSVAKPAAAGPSPMPPAPPPPTPPAPPSVPAYTPPAPAYTPPASTPKPVYVEPAPNLTPAGKAFDIFGQQMTAALKALGVSSDGTLSPGVGTAESVQAATSLAALMDANGFTSQATALRGYARRVADSLAKPKCPGVPVSLPLSVQEAVCRAMTYERDPVVLRGLIKILRGLPQSSEEPVMTLIRLLEVTAAQLEAKQSEADTARKIEEVMKNDRPENWPEPIADDKHSPPTLPAELEALVAAALKGLGVKAGIVKGPVTAEALDAAEDAADALTNNGQEGLAAQMKHYIDIARAMVGGPVTPAAAPAPTSRANTYRIQKDDNPSKLALRFTGDANRWPELVKANPQYPVDPKTRSFKRFDTSMTLNLPASWPATPAGAAPALPAPAAAAPVSTTYVIQKDDNPSVLARRFTGDANRWRELRAANPTMTVDNKTGNFKYFPAGKTINLPASWVAGA